jgi:hypothetical protein
LVAIYILVCHPSNIGEDEYDKTIRVFSHIRSVKMFPEKSRTSNEKMLFSINKALAKLQKGK